MRYVTAYGGRTRYEATTPFRQSVIGWAGIIMEELVEQEDWSEASVSDCDDFHLFINEHSESDQQAVNGHPMRRRAFSTALRILIKRRVEVEAEAAALVLEKLRGWNDVDSHLRDRFSVCARGGR